MTRSILFISLQQILSRLVPFALHTFAKTSLDPAAASVRSRARLAAAARRHVTACRWTFLRQKLPIMLRVRLLGCSIAFSGHSLRLSKLNSPHNTSLASLQLGSVRFPLMLAVAYAVGRDGVRRACLRASSERSLHAAMRALLPISLGLVMAAVALVTMLTWRADTSAGSGDYRHALWLHALALALETLNEFCYIPAMWHGRVLRESVIEVAARTADALVFWASVTAQRVR